MLDYYKIAIQLDLYIYIYIYNPAGGNYGYVCHTTLYIVVVWAVYVFGEEFMFCTNYMHMNQPLAKTFSQSGTTLGSGSALLTQVLVRMKTRWFSRQCVVSRWCSVLWEYL